jgi:hypothetical protein
LGPVVDARLFEISEIFGVIDMSLWIQIPVADFDGMIEMEIVHGAIIPFDKKDLSGFGKANQSGLYLIYWGAGSVYGK